MSFMTVYSRFLLAFPILYNAKCFASPISLKKQLLKYSKLANETFLKVFLNTVFGHRTKKIWTLGFAVARKRRFTRQVARKVFSLSNSLALFVWHSAKKWISELPEYRRGRHSVALYQIDGVAFCCYQSDKLSIMKHWCFYRKLFEASKNSVKSTQTLPSWINNIGFERACSIFALMHCLYRQRSNSLTKHSDFFAKKTP